MANPIDLKMTVIDGDYKGPHLLISGGVHGDEYEPMTTVRRLREQITPAQLSGRLTLVPVANESAFELGQRCGEDGLDLARVFPGRPDGSITEQVAYALTEIIEEADYFVDLHTGGNICQVLPMAGYSLHPNEEILESQRKMARAFNLPFIWGTTPNLDGRSLSAARDANVPAIYAEYLGGGGCSEKGIHAYTEGCLNIMATLSMIDRTLPEPYIEYVVEDERENAGYMQINNPSPMSGYFEPTVELGQFVCKGHELGTVCDPNGDRVETVVSAQSGIILTLRTRPPVEKGDFLAVIVDVNRPLGGF
jgi:predicted deacylase